ncbi:MAG: hypothetical protein AAFZ05_08395, partial [Pseudomonadota bacterium]
MLGEAAGSFTGIMECTKLLLAACINSLGTASYMSSTFNVPLVWQYVTMASMFALYSFLQIRG